MRFPAVHANLSFFEKCYAEPLTPWIGRPPKAWLTNIGSAMASDAAVPVESPSRKMLYDLWSSDTDTEVCALVTLAWGGMRVNHGRALLAHRTHWKTICDDLRNGEHTRQSAYDAFKRLRTERKLPGMGPAYFTKLIHFACPKAKGYILDQWTARSVHALTNQASWPAVQVSVRATSINPSSLRVRVIDRVSAADYEDYCDWIDSLATHLLIPGVEVEEKLFSSGGKNPHEWRKHVLADWLLRPGFYKILTGEEFNA